LCAVEAAWHDEHMEPDYRRFEYVPVGRLVIDPRIERSIRPGIIDMIATEFDWARMEVLTVIERVEHSRTVYVVVEGQHRTLACKRFGDSFQVPVMVVPTRARPREPRIAYDISTGRRKHSAVDRLKLLYHSDEPYAIAIMTALGKRGLQPGSSRSSRTLSAVGTLLELVRLERRSPEEGGAFVGDVLDLILSAWPTDDPEHPGSRFDGHMLKGVGMLINRNPQYEPERLADTMKARTATAWVDRQNTREKPWVSVVTSLAHLYNRHLRSDDRRLQW
jgi:hypothetical protein